MTPFALSRYTLNMPRKLSPSGEAFLYSYLGSDAEAAIKAINDWTPPVEHNHRCNEPPFGSCAPLLRELFGKEEGNRMRDAINGDAERFNRSRADRAEAQGLMFPSRAKPITKDMLDHQREVDRDRQRRRRARLAEARRVFAAKEATQ